ncbi:hypothetical protein ES708_08466 [subsurface metagenome]
MKKIGLLALALVLALGTFGVAYAAWTDTIYIEGTVNTGSVDLSIVELSSTLVYKVVGLEPDEIVIVHQRVNMRPSDGITWSVINDPPIPANGILIASAITTSPSDDHITVTFDNAFPLDTLTADFIVHYVGSIPAKVDAELTGFTGTPEDLALLEAAAAVHFFEWDEVTGKGEEIFDVVQMHYCDYVYCVMTLDIPQEDQYMNLNGGFSAVIEAIQWNEYGQ